ncbi:MAG: CinA family protein [Chloroflexi bacterium]|nr:CinA family protein [Chloroflexota bacterium]
MPDLSSMASSVGALLKEKGHTVAVAESSCGGLISASLVAVPGASAYYVGGSTVYTRVAQKGLLDVPDGAMEGKRASTEEYALMNASRIRESLGTTWGLAETGASGPTGNRYGDASGHACFAVVGPVERAFTLETADTDREANMWVFAHAALDLLEKCIQES